MVSGTLTDRQMYQLCIDGFEGSEIKMASRQIQGADVDPQLLMRAENCKNINPGRAL